jgi:O-antigen ligase
MYFALLPLLFMCITTSLNEPLNLARSALFVTWVLLFVAFSKSRNQTNNRLNLILTLMPILYLFSTMANNQNPVLAIMGNYNRNFGILTLVAIAISVNYICGSNLNAKQLLYWGIFPVFIGSVIYSYIQSNNLDPLVWSETDRTVLTLGNSDYAAALLGILIVLPVFGFLKLKKISLKILMCILLILTWRAGINSQAFQFRVIAPLSIFMFIFLYYLPRIKQINVLVKIFSVLAVILGLGGYVISNSTELVVRTSFTDRMSQQILGLKMFSDHPLFGVGIDQFWRFTPIYLTDQDVRRNGPNVVPDKTHNLIIDHLAMGGIFVGLVFTFFLIYSLFIVYKINSIDLNIEDRREISVLSAIWITYVIHLFISTDNLFMMVLCYFVFGILAKNYFRYFPSRNLFEKTRFKGKPIPQGLLRSSALVLLLGVSILNFKAISTDIQVKKILAAEVQSGDEIIRNIRAFPNPKAAEEIIVNLMQNLGNCPVATVASDDLLKIDNRSAQAFYFKTLCADSASDQKLAILFIDKAIQLQPRNMIYLDAKVRLSHYLGLSQTANETFERMKEIDSNYQTLESLKLILQSKIAT